MPQQRIHVLVVGLDGSITEKHADAHITLDQRWMERYQSGAELALVSAPVPSDANERQRRLVAKTINRFIWQGKRYALWPVAPDATDFVGEVDPGVLMLSIDREGKVSERRDIKTAPYPTRMLAGRLYPGIDLALVQVPTKITEEEQIVVRNAMAALFWKGKRYRLVGATGGAKEGKFYFAEQKWEDKLARRYQRWPEAAIAYFGILVSECEKALIEVDATVKVVRDNELGTNDCRGWVTQSLFDKLTLEAGRFYQFRLAFSGVQAKGAFKVMPDEVALHPDVYADVVIPESSLKPACPEMVGRSFTGRIVLGVREMSRIDSTTKGSYTVIQHAGWDVIEQEIIPQCVQEIGKLNQGWDVESHHELLEQIGGDNSSTGFYRVMEACLAADRDGSLIRHPYVHRGVKKLLAQWAYTMLTGGGMRMPGAALADDGYLAIENGQLYTGSDWIPMDTALTNQPGDRGLCVRFPVRMAEDLLPMKHASGAAAAGLLQDRGISAQLAERIVSDQLYLKGTYVLHSATAKKFGGDYDFDGVCVINEAQYPKFVEYRFDMQERPQPAKEKRAKEKTPWFNLVQVAFLSMGNRIGQITNTMSSAIAAGMPDYVYDLVPELQKEIDGLKHGTRADTQLVAEIGKKVGKPGWLDIDRKLKSIDDLPGAVTPLSEADLIGRMYNVLRKELAQLIGEPMPIRNFAALFHGLYGTEKLPVNMLQECRIIVSFYGEITTKINQWLDRAKDILKAARQELQAARDGGDKVEILVASGRVRAAEGALADAEVKHRRWSAQFRSIVSAWGAGKPEPDRMKWAAALNHVVCRGQGSGSALFHAFPQEIVDGVSGTTGGERLMVESWNQPWWTVIDTENRVLYRTNLDSTRTPLFLWVEANEPLENGGIRKSGFWKRACKTDALEMAAGLEDLTLDTVNLD